MKTKPKELKGKVVGLTTLGPEMGNIIYESGRSGIGHVSMANYASREREATTWLQEAADKVDAVYDFLNQRLYCNMIEGYFKNIHLISKWGTHREYRVGKTSWYFTVDIWGNHMIRQVMIRGYNAINNLNTLGDFINFMINKKIPLVWKGA